MKPITIPIVILILALSLPSCKKNSSTPYVAPGLVLKSDYVKFSTIGMQYVKLPLNAYYIYKDSATGMLDSVVVTESLLEKKFSAAHTSIFTINGRSSPINFPDFYYDEFQLVLTKYAGTTTEKWLSMQGKNTDEVFSLYHTPDSSINLAGEFLGIPSSYYFTYRSPHPTVLSLSNEIIPSIVVEGKTYTDVYKVSRNIAGNYDRYYYWVKGVGLIKRVENTLTSAKTWTLVRNS
jgi:hypothetical protein